MSDHLDVAVLGAGPGGYIAALKAAKHGATVAIIEKEHLGGACLNYGCIPSKALLASAELAHKLTHAGDLGLEIGSVKVHWDKIQKRKDRILRGLRNGTKSLLTGRGVTIHQGEATLDGPNKIVVTDGKGTTQTLTADKIIVAVGSEPSRIPGWPEDKERICTSNEALHWSTLPKRLLIVGGGVIGCEFACMMQAYGVEVTVVEMLPGLLPGMDEHLGCGLLEVFKRRGITCHLGAKVDDLTLKDKDVTARLSSGEVIVADRVLVATGRRPRTGGIGLEKAGLSLDRGFVRVDDRMETPVRGIYCIGDANGRCLLAHAASAHGVVAADNATGHNATMTAPVPFAVYTFPEVAAVGMTQEQARERKIPVSVGSFKLGFLGKSLTVNETDGFVKVIRHRLTGDLLGVHMLGHNVTECIHAAGAMLHHKVGAREAAETIMAHPTISEGLHEALEDSYGEALHLPPRKVVRVAG